MKYIEGKDRKKKQIGTFRYWELFSSLYRSSTSYVILHILIEICDSEWLFLNAPWAFPLTPSSKSSCVFPWASG